MTSLIAAIAKNNLLGAYDVQGNGYLPWPRLGKDFKHFRETTMGKNMVMGSTTLFSLPGPLKGRNHRVLTSAPGNLLERLREHEYANDFFKAFDSNRLTLVASLEEALWCDDSIIIGGASVYCQAFEKDLVDKMYLTFIDEEYDRNLLPQQKVLMPKIPFDRFKEFSEFQEITIPRTDNTPSYTIKAYEKK